MPSADGKRNGLRAESQGYFPPSLYVLHACSSICVFCMSVRLVVSASKGFSQPSQLGTDTDHNQADIIAGTFCIEGGEFLKPVFFLRLVSWNP